jgi:hypothetical protein
MAVAFVSASTKVLTGTATIAMTYPTGPGPSAGDIILAGRVLWDTSAAVATAEPGWTVGPDLFGGSNGGLADNHNTRIHVDYIEAVGGETGTLTFDQTGVPVNGGVAGAMLCFSKAAGTTWGIVGASGDDAAHGTNRTVASSTSIPLAVGDWVAVFVAVDTDASLTVSSPAITAPGITFGATTRGVTGPGSATGNDGNIESYRAQVTAGTATAVVTLNMTTVTNQCGPAAFIRMREIAGGAPQFAAFGIPM